MLTTRQAFTLLVLELEPCLLGPSPKQWEGIRCI